MRMVAGIGGGRGNLRVAKTPPLTVGIAGIAPTIIHAHEGINRDGVEADSDAARRYVLRRMGE